MRHRNHQCSWRTGASPFYLYFVDPRARPRPVTPLAQAVSVQAVSQFIIALWDSRCLLADAVAKRYRPWPKGLRADSLPWFDSPLVQGTSRLRYTDKAQVAATGPYWPKGARKKKKGQSLLVCKLRLCVSFGFLCIARVVPVRLV